MSSRGPKWSFWETLLPIESVIVVRNKYVQIIGNVEMMREFNRVYVDLIEECEKQNQGVGHHGFPDRRISFASSLVCHSQPFSDSLNTSPYT